MADNTSAEIAGLKKYIDERLEHWLNRERLKEIVKEQVKLGISESEAIKELKGSISRIGSK